MTPETNLSGNTCIDVVLPVYNEELQIRPPVERLINFLTQNVNQKWQIIIANNGSIDKTSEMARALTLEHQNVHLINIPEKGRGRALKQVWRESEAQILSTWT